MPRLIILSGPSCVGKGPLLKALRRFYPEIAFGLAVRYTNRAPRPGETEGVEFHFRPATEIRALPSERFFVYPMRHQWQALDLDEVESLLIRHERVITELYPPATAPLLANQRLRAMGAAGVEIHTVFLTPLTDEELAALAAAAPERPREDIVADVMRIKQIGRALKQGKLLTAAELDDIAIRAGHAYGEMQYASSYSQVIVNHDGEDSDHWFFEPPIGDAGRTLREFAHILAAER